MYTASVQLQDALHCKFQNSLISDSNAENQFSQFEDKINISILSVCCNHNSIFHLQGNLVQINVTIFPLLSCY